MLDHCVKFDPPIIIAMVVSIYKAYNPSWIYLIKFAKKYLVIVKDKRNTFYL